MNKFITLLTAVLSCIVLSSCGTTSYLATGHKLDDMRNVVLFEPVSKIETIGKGQITVTNDTACLASQALLLDTFNTYETGLNIDSTYSPASTVEEEIIKKGIESVYAQYLNSTAPRNFSAFVVPESLDKIIENTGNRYGMIVYHYGFSRTGANYAAQIAKGIGIAILTLGSVYTVPYKDRSNINVFIIDSEQDIIAWQNFDIAADYNPLKQKHINRQFKRLFKPFRL